MEANDANNNGLGPGFTWKVLLGMLLGLVVGLVVKWLPMSDQLRDIIIHQIFDTAGQLFINLIKMLVVPIVLVSIICGTSSLGDLQKLGRVGGKTVGLYLFTTALAISIGLIVATLVQVGKGASLAVTVDMTLPQALSFKGVLLGFIPDNPVAALASGSLLQIILFAVLFGVAMASIGARVKPLVEIFQSANEVLMKLILIVMKTAPYGVFFLLAGLFAKVGFHLIWHLLGYFVVVLGVLAIQSLVIYTSFIRVFGRLNPWIFLQKLYAAMLFAFSVSSSNASIPIVLETVEHKLGVNNSVASFVIPLGSTINMDGTAIMQGVARVFIANAYGIHLGFLSYFLVVVMASLASIGTAGVPSVGLITLTMVLAQVGLPAQGVALIFGVDRLLDMARTAVNICGDAMVACVVAKSEGALDEAKYYKRHKQVVIS